jgi:hypothetical protein
MDLSTVLQNIESNVYATKEACAADVRLIWSNSLQYNAPGSRIYSATKMLSELWESHWATICVDDIARPPTIDELKQWIRDCHW